MIYKFCPYCKEDIILNNNVYTCSSCNQKIYIDPKPTVAIIPVKDNSILITRRAVEPHKGEYDLIGGFVDANENLEEAAIREMKEETNLEAKNLEYFNSYSDTYNDLDNYVVSVTYIVKDFEGDIIAKDDVASLEWIPINKIPELVINGFKNTKEALMDFYNKVGDR